MRELSAQPWVPWGPSLLRTRAFRAQRVIIVGPAQTVCDDLDGTDVDAYDVVVRLNNGMTLSDGNPERLGRRTDLLIHNSREDGPRGAGVIPPEVLRAHGVGTLVFPFWRKPQHRKAFMRKARQLRQAGGPDLKLVPPPMMARMRADIGDRPPSVGTTAIMFFLSAPLAELAIHGFTFFETTYAPGYNDAVVTDADAMAWVDAQGAHAPASEKSAIRARLENARPDRIVLGEGVRRHLYAE